MADATIYQIYQLIMLIYILATYIIYSGSFVIVKKLVDIFKTYN